MFDLGETRRTALRFDSESARGLLPFSPVAAAALGRPRLGSELGSRGIRPLDLHHRGSPRQWLLRRGQSDCSCGAVIRRGSDNQPRERINDGGNSGSNRGLYARTDPLQRNSDGNAGSGGHSTAAHCDQRADLRNGGSARFDPG